MFISAKYNLQSSLKLRMLVPKLKDLVIDKTALL